MEASVQNGSELVIYISVALGLFLIWAISRLMQSSSTKEISNEEPQTETDAVPKKSEKKVNGKKSNQVKLRKVSSGPFHHNALVTSLKGHSGNVLGLDLSCNGKYLASCSEDRSVRLWSVKEFGSGNRNIRCNVEFDHAIKVRFSSDSRAFVAGLSYDSTVRVFKLGKKDDGVTTTCVPIEGDFPRYGKAKLLNVGIGTNPNGGSFVMTAYEDTTIAVRNLKGEVLHTVNTNQSNNNAAWVSRCGRFFASCGWTPDVKVWAVNFTKGGAFTDVTRAFVLKGHTASVWSFAFNLDSTRMISVSKDGTWRLYDTQVEYENDQEPYLLNSNEFNVCGFSPTEHKCLVALSSDGCVAAVALLNNLTVFSTTTGEVELQVAEVHSEIITSVAFDIAGKYVLTAGDKHVRVFHNTMGYKEKIRNLEASIKKVSEGSAIHQRQQKMLDDAKKALKKIEDSIHSK